MEVVWVRRDARIADNAALCAAVEHARKHDRPVCVFFAYDPRWVQGQHCHASHCEFVEQGLRELDTKLKQQNRNAGILVYLGRTEDGLSFLRAEYGVKNLWYHLVVGDADLQSIDEAVAQWCRQAGVEQKEFDQYGLVQGGRLQKGKSIFASSFERAMSVPLLSSPPLGDVNFARLPLRLGLQTPSSAVCLRMRCHGKQTVMQNDALLERQGLEAVPQPIDEVEVVKMTEVTWASLGVEGGLRPLAPEGGESNALACLNDFLTRRGKTYQSGLSSPLTAWDSCSRLSAYLAWGHISLRTIVQATQRRQEELRQMKKFREDREADDTELPGSDVAELGPDEGEKDSDVKPSAKKDSWLRSLQQFQSRLRWRTHFMQKLHDEPSMATENLARGYDGMRQESSSRLTVDERKKLGAWLSGRTGYPFVDACMRSLHDRGWINFRMRCMLVSFASYDLWLSWKHIGPPLAKLFIDYEPGIHYPQLQMQSGTTGINSNRIYDSLKQLKDHDPNCVFLKVHVPELVDVPNKILLGHQRGDRQSNQADRYPAPIVNSSAALKFAREQLKEFNRRVKHDTSESKQVFQKHGSRRPNAGDLQRSVRGSPPGTEGLGPSDNGLAQGAGEGEFARNDEEPRGIITELARSSRSKCRLCRESIDKGAIRCGLEVKVNSRWELHWCHARCFLISSTQVTRYQTNRKATCRGSGQSISKGDPIVRFKVGEASATMHLAVAKAKLSALTYLAQEKDTDLHELLHGSIEDFLDRLLQRGEDEQGSAGALRGAPKIFNRLKRKLQEETAIDLSEQVNPHVQPPSP